MTTAPEAGGDETVVPPAGDGTVEQRWVSFVHGADRTGTLTALASVFSTRGVSFDSIGTGDVSDGIGLVVVTFTASERRQGLLTRTLRRLAAVRSVEVYRADDPAVRAAGVVRLPAGTVFVPPPDTAVRWSGDTTAGQPLLVEGPLVDVEQVVAQARARGAESTAVVILRGDGPSVR